MSKLEEMQSKYLNGKLYWTTKDGEEIFIKDMSSEHIYNTIHYLKRRLKMVCDKKLVKNWISIFKSEYKYRK
jgi:hypothetical protein